MKTQPSIPVGLVALSYALVLLSGDVVAQSGNFKELCIHQRIGDGHCDKSQNNEACGYDGGDCCECTCTSGPKFACGSSNFACLDPTASCIEGIATANTVTIECFPDLFSDGDCNPSNNNEECGYDSGDCCECTCVSTDSFTCGEDTHGGFECLDPSAPCVPDDVDDDGDDTVSLEPSQSSYTDVPVNSSCVPVYIADGDCDLFNNNEECGYDGGDCCGCTCVSTLTFTCGDEEFGGFACLDPSAPCVDDDDFTSLPQDDSYYTSYTSSSVCITGFFSDAYCDLSNNNEECGYDGGDCCECTCVDTDSFTCGVEGQGFACLDPSAPCVDDDDVTTLTYSGSSTSLSCVPSYFSDGLCDQNNNNEDCGYDGGDCCECTCVSTESFTCGDEEFGGFACLDPGAPCVDDDDFILPAETNTTTSSSDFTTSLGCIPSYFGDAYCDQTNNNEICGYDGGDCCQCTCISTRDFICGVEGQGFACVDPSAPCVDDDDVTTVPSSDTYTYTYPGSSTSLSCVPDYFSDGLCDRKNNNEDCGYDGGDCCECTCVSTEEFTCGDEEFGGFACLDPSAPCVDDDDFTPVPENNTTTSSEFSDLGCIPFFFSDAYCDQTNNNELCGYDGGDCCECTCISTRDFICGVEAQGFACVDPSAPCVDDDDVTVIPEDDSYTFYTSSTYYTSTGFTSTFSCLTGYFADGYCDLVNNRKECGFDGGDCCQCTCVDASFTCGDEANGGFDCIDPNAPCADDDDDIVSLQSSTSSVCIPENFSDGLCDEANNNEGCGYDGGDCCECTCTSTSDFTCGENGGFDCIDPDSSCEEDLVEAGTKTTIGVSSNAYDTRVGEAFGDVGCGQDGCEPELTRDGSLVSESRWSCVQNLDPDGGMCEIGFVFEDPQDIMEVQVAFYKADERARTLQAMVNGDVVGEFDSSPATPFTSLDIQGVGVETMTFKTVGLAENDWIGLLEVRFMVEP